jgi:hypothetical protein
MAKVLDAHWPITISPIKILLVLYQFFRYLEALSCGFNQCRTLHMSEVTLVQELVKLFCGQNVVFSLDAMQLPKKNRCGNYQRWQ